jgi:hypothetical protein
VIGGQRAAGSPLEAGFPAPKGSLDQLAIRKCPQTRRLSLPLGVGQRLLSQSRHNRELMENRAYRHSCPFRELGRRRIEDAIGDEAPKCRDDALAVSLATEEAPINLCHAKVPRNCY